jgi:hypothetical protein
VAYRVDLSRIKPGQRTPQGGIRIPATLTRTGVFTYYDDAGNERRELRHPDEVFAADAMKSLDTAVVTVGHPGRVTADNFKTLGIGNVIGQRRDGDFVAADLVVQEKAAVERVDRGDLEEISCGYDCELDETPGVWNGERYDAVQRNYQYNHVGLGPRGWGRLGSDVRLKLDGGEKGAIRVAYTPGMPDDKDIQTRLDALTSDHSRVVAERDRLQGRLDAQTATLNTLTTENAELKRKLVGAESAERIDGIVKARTLVLDGARLLQGKEDIGHAGKSDREIKIAALKACDPKFDAKDENGKDRTDDYISARFDAAIEFAKAAGASLANLRRNVDDVTKQDSDDELVKAQEEFEKNNKDAWKRGLEPAGGK